MTNNQLSKNCINCNLQKPLTAYLQITGPQGTSYGNICSTCRGSGLGKKVTLPVNEDSSTSSSSTGLKIDHKAKVQADLEKKIAVEKRQEEDKKEREQLDLKNEALENRKILKKEMEEKHRKEFIEPSKAKSFLEYQSKKPEDKRTAIEKRAMDEVMQHDADAREETKIKSFDDLTVTRIDPTQANTKMASAEWKKFRALLGRSAAVNVVEQQLHTELTKHDTLLEEPGHDADKPAETLNHQNVQTNKPDATPKAGLNFGINNNNNNNKKEALLSYTQKNFEDEKPAPTSPGSRRR